MKDHREAEEGAVVEEEGLAEAEAEAEVALMVVLTAAPPTTGLKTVQEGTRMGWQGQTDGAWGWRRVAF